jgi:hypothetical protein
MLLQLFRFGEQVHSVLRDVDHADGIVATEIEIVQTSPVDLHCGASRRAFLGNH